MEGVESFRNLASDSTLSDFFNVFQHQISEEGRGILSKDGIMKFIDDSIENIESKFLLVEEDSSSEKYRGDTLSEISSGLNLLASGIKVVTALLSLFGADNVDR